MDAMARLLRNTLRALLVVHQLEQSSLLKTIAAEDTPEPFKDRAVVRYQELLRRIATVVEGLRVLDQEGAAAVVRRGLTDGDLADEISQYVH